METSRVLLLKEQAPKGYDYVYKQPNVNYLNESEDSTVTPKLTTEELDKIIPTLFKGSSTSSGKVKMIILRPETLNRLFVNEVEVVKGKGIVGDKWTVDVSTKTDYEEREVSIMNYRALKLISGSDVRCALAGDNIIVDMDLDGCQPGDIFTIGDVTLKISPDPHPGCARFQRRYGKDVREYFNSSDKFHFRLRGVLSNVLRDGVIHVGDDIVKRADLALSQLTK